MYKYLLLNLLFMSAAAFVCISIRRPSAGKRLAIAVVALLVLTLIFDNVLIGLDIIRYNDASLLGFKLGKAPIEDFAYALVAAVAMPAVWSKLKKHS